MKIDKKKLRSRCFEFLMATVGALLIAASTSCFLVPNEVASGGFSGVAIMIYSQFGLPVGTVVLIMNIPVFLIGLKKFGWRFLISTILTTVLMSVAIDVFAVFLPAYNSDRLLGTIFGGVLLGIGMGLVFYAGTTTGGVDIIAKLLEQRFPFMSMGNLMLVLDGIVVICAAIVYQSIEAALYAIVAIYIQGKAIDLVVYGADKGRMLLINSQQYEKISGRIINELDRGVTLLDSYGGYTGNPGKLILCAVRRYEVAKVHHIVREEDIHAFVIIVDAGEIVGEGFKSHKT